jgi:hypothetical protein
MAELQAAGAENGQPGTPEEWGSKTDVGSLKSLDPLPNSASQLVISKGSIDLRLSTLKGKIDYETWAAGIKDAMRKMGIAYVIEYSGSIYGPLGSSERRYHNEVACDLIYQYMGAERAKNLRARLRELRVAKSLWAELRNDIYHSCTCETDSLGDIDCTFCQSVLEAIESNTPGWTRSSAIPTRMRKPWAKRSRETSRGVGWEAYDLKSVVIGKGTAWKRKIEFFLQPGKNVLSLT